MGFFSNVGKNFGSFLGLDSAMPQSQTPPPDGRLANQADQMRIQASGMRDTLASRQKDTGNMYGEGLRHQLAQGMTGSRQNASARGLLYGGLQQGREAGLRNQAGSQMAQGQAQINRQLEDETYGAENQALGALMQQRQMEQERQKAALAEMIANNQMQQQAGSGLFGGVGIAKGLFG